jgi:DNA (cytosine-5)-methyltransferase 1
MSDVHTASSKALFTVVSTFAGGGGSSTGYRLSGGKVLLVNEFVPEAVNTYKVNFPDTPVDPSDIRDITRKNGKKGITDWLKKYDIKPHELDLLDGSPPCSTFSVSGKGSSKAGEMNVQYSDVTQDRIGYLILEYILLASVVKPKVTVFENVPQMRNSPIYHQAVSDLKKCGYFVSHRILQSSNFGVPQRRKRLFVIGVRKDVAKKVGITCDDDIQSLYPRPSSYEPTVHDAIRDLEIDKLERNMILDHVRKSRHYEILRAIPTDPERVDRLAYHNDKFKNYLFNVNRCAWHQPAPTITQLGNQLGGLGGVYHPEENRSFTVKELLRLFSLPDDFRLTGTFNQRAERVGRMVTPYVTKELSKSIYDKVLKWTD